MHPPTSLLRAEDNAAMIAAVNTASPDILWVQKTAPKQEKWLIEHRDHLLVGAEGAVGAAFDFFAETVNRSPTIFRRFGFQWLPLSCSAKSQALAQDIYFCTDISC